MAWSVFLPSDLLNSESLLVHYLPLLSVSPGQQNARPRNFQPALIRQNAYCPKTMCFASRSVWRGDGDAAQSLKDLANFSSRQCHSPRDRGAGSSICLAWRKASRVEAKAVQGFHSPEGSYPKKIFRKLMRSPAHVERCATFQFTTLSCQSAARNISEYPT